MASFFGRRKEKRYLLIIKKPNVMKKLLFLFGITTAMIGVSANTLTFGSKAKVVSYKQDEKKTEIPVSALPEKITKSITSANKDSKITKAYKVLDAKGNLTGYEVVVVTDSKEETLNFDKNGDKAM